MSKGKGWYNHPHEHSLARKGIKTAKRDVSIDNYKTEIWEINEFQSPDWANEARERLANSTGVDVNVEYTNENPHYDPETNTIHIFPPTEYNKEDWLDVLAHEYTHSVVGSYHGRRQSLTETQFKKIVRGEEIDWKDNVDKRITKTRKGSRLYRNLEKLIENDLVPRKELDFYMDEIDYIENGYIEKVKIDNKVYFRITPIGVETYNRSNLDE